MTEQEKKNMRKELKTKSANTDKRNYVVSTITARLEKREDVTLKQEHTNDFDLKIGSRSIVRIVANKTDVSNASAIYPIAFEYLEEIKKLEAVKDYKLAYPVNNDACCFRFNYETIGEATNSALAIFDFIDKALKAKTEAKKTETKKQETAKTEDKKQETKTETAKKTETKTGDKKQDTAKTENKKQEKKTENKKADKKANKADKKTENKKQKGVKSL